MPKEQIDISDSAYEDLYRLISANVRPDIIRKMIVRKDGSKKCPVIPKWRFHRGTFIQHVIEQKAIYVPTFRELVSYIVIDIDNHDGAGKVEEKWQKITSILGKTVSVTSSDNGGVHMYYKLPRLMLLSKVRDVIRKCLESKMSLDNIDLCPVNLKLPFGPASFIYLGKYDSHYIIGAKYNHIVFFNNNMQSLDKSLFQQVGEEGGREEGGRHSKMVCEASSIPSSGSKSKGKSTNNHAGTSKASKGEGKESKGHSKMVCEGTHSSRNTIIREGERVQAMYALFYSYKYSREAFSQMTVESWIAGGKTSKDFKGMSVGQVREFAGNFYDSMMKSARIKSKKTCKKSNISDEEFALINDFIDLVLPDIKLGNCKTQQGAKDAMKRYVHTVYSLLSTKQKACPNAETYEIPAKALLHRISPRYAYFNGLLREYGFMKISTSYDYSASKCYGYSMSGFKQFQAYIVALSLAKGDVKELGRYSKMVCEAPPPAPTTPNIPNIPNIPKIPRELTKDALHALNFMKYRENEKAEEMAASLAPKHPSRTLQEGSGQAFEASRGLDTKNRESLVSEAARGLKQSAEELRAETRHNELASKEVAQAQVNYSAWQKEQWEREMEKLRNTFTRRSNGTMAT